jgi:hypothetical protein
MLLIQLQLALVLLIKLELNLTILIQLKLAQILYILFLHHTSYQLLASSVLNVFSSYRSLTFIFTATLRISKLLDSNCFTKINQIYLGLECGLIKEKANILRMVARKPLNMKIWFWRIGLMQNIAKRKSCATDSNGFM